MGPKVQGERHFNHAGARRHRLPDTGDRSTDAGFLPALYTVRCGHRRRPSRAGQTTNILRRDKEGLIFADLDVEGCPSIPVSKPNYDKLSSLL